MLISAFEDGERCAKTIFRALQQARHPGRLSFNVLQARRPSAKDCLQEFKSKHLPELCAGGSSGCSVGLLSRVHFWMIPAEEGMGPVHQRGLLGEKIEIPGKGDMCLSTDSHMDFTADWDQDLLGDWAAAENEFAVLTAYPLATADKALAGRQSWISLCGYFITGSGVPRGATGGTLFNENTEVLAKPVLTMNWAAGQSFSRCHAEKNVPVDKNLRWMFDGEEIDRAVRLWTHGYDLYNPSINVVLHNYTHANQAFWSYRPASQIDDQARSNERLKTLLQGRATTAAFGPYGLGSQRSLAQYVAWSHTDLGGPWPRWPNQRESRTDFCRGLKRAPVRSPSELAAAANA